MRQLVQLEGSSWCGAITSAMVLDHFGVPWDLDAIKRRFAQLEGCTVDNYGGCRSDHNVASVLVEHGLDVIFAQFGHPMRFNEEHKYWHMSHKPRDSRIATWYAAYDLIRCGYVAIVAIVRDAGKGHYVCIDDAFMRAGEHWLSIWCPIRGHYEEQAERFLLTVDGEGHATEWVFAKRRPARFASAAEQAPKEEVAT